MVVVFTVVVKNSIRDDYGIVVAVTINSNNSIDIINDSRHSSTLVSENIICKERNEMPCTNTDRKTESV